jgi:hypothetical protein
MSTFLTTLSEKTYLSDENAATSFVIDYFKQSSRPFDDLLEYLFELTASELGNKNTGLIQCLLHSFTQWKNTFYQSSSLPACDKPRLNDLLQTLPLTTLKDFTAVFHISKEDLITLLKSLLKSPNNSQAYKRALNILVMFDYQFEFPLNELLLPLIVNSRDHLIDVYLNKTRRYEEYLLGILNHLYETNGKRIRDILSEEYQLPGVTLNKKNLSKLAVRYWNLYGNDEDEKYPNLTILQQKRTLAYLMNVKYNGITEEKSMSDECWKELVGVSIN